MDLILPASTYLIDIPDFNESDRAKAFLELQAQQTAIQNLLLGESEIEILDLIAENRINVDQYIKTTVANIDFVINNEISIERWT
jgi:hypothetical protein